LNAGLPSFTFSRWQTQYRIENMLIEWLGARLT